VDSGIVKAVLAVPRIFVGLVSSVAVTVTDPTFVSKYLTEQELLGPIGHEARGGRNDPVEDDVLNTTISGGEGELDEAPGTVAVHTYSKACC
jgi:hypothetical protein